MCLGYAADRRWYRSQTQRRRARIGLPGELDFKSELFGIAHVGVQGSFQSMLQRCRRTVEIETEAAVAFQLHDVPSANGEHTQDSLVMQGPGRGLRRQVEREAVQS